MKKYSLLSCLLYLCLNINAEQQDTTCVHLNEISVTAVTGRAKMKHTPTPISVVSATQLNGGQFSNLIDAISRQPGVNQITTGAGISKPIIRGLGFNRVLVVDRGVRQEGQQWGEEHGLEIDANSVGSIEIQKGPATLMYGSDALAGVVITHDAPIMPIGNHRINLSGEYQTNHGLWNYSANATGNHNNFFYDWRWSQKAAHDYKNAIDGRITNSRFAEQALSGILGVSRSWGISKLRLSYYHIRPGIVEGERDAITGELEQVDKSCSYAKLMPYQHVRHYKAISDNTFYLPNNARIELILGYQQNRRQEFEEEHHHDEEEEHEHEEHSHNDAALDFLLHSATYDIRYIAPKWGAWHTNLGIGGMYQKSLNKGEEFLIPAYNLFDIGLYATISRSWWNRLHLSGGLRYDTRYLHSHALSEEGSLRFADFHRNFNGLTGSIGAVYNLTPQWDIRTNISRGYRAPNLSELGSNGQHEGALRYEMGDSNLKSEQSWQFDLGTQWSSRYVSLEANLFANMIDNFIYLRGTGELSKENTPIYKYHQNKALLTGGEARVIVHPINHLHIENTLQYVYTKLLHQPETRKHLPFTPAPRWIMDIHYDLPLRVDFLHQTGIGLSMEHNMRQKNIFSEDGTETPTPAYTLLGVNAQTEIRKSGRTLFTIALNCSNLLNKTYQHHLSRLKYAPANPITGRQGISNMGRNFSIKISVPIQLKSDKML